VQAAHDIATKAAGTEVIMVADSEADIFELMVEGQSLEGRAEWIAAACQDRAVRLQKDAADDAARSISQALQKATCLATYEVNVRGREPKVSCEKRGRRQPRESRKATVECRLHGHAAGPISSRP
jgi:hypothetical protein